jgi:CRP-like cAMP-binding protein
MLKDQHRFYLSCLCASRTLLHPYLLSLHGAPHQGALGSCLHFITDGEVAVRVSEPEGGVRELFHRFKGQVVGEFGIMQGKRRSASVVCVTKCSVSGGDVCAGLARDFHIRLEADAALASLAHVPYG